MKRRIRIHVRGKRHEWDFHFEGDPKYIEEWREDGLEVDEIPNSIPFWLPARLAPAWLFAQDVVNFRNPFAG